MNPENVALLRCPKTGQQLHFTKGTIGAEYDGFVVSEDGVHSYPVLNGVPRFVSSSNYAENFGFQWNSFRKTQLDSHSGHSISADRFWKATGWDPQSLRGKFVLDVGCGAGRFAEVALAAGANVVALDYSSAVDACYQNLGHESNIFVVQGDIYSLPFAPSSFDFVYSLGVLQHTPDVATAFAALPRMLRPGGELVVDFYWKRLRTLLHAKYFFRPFFRHMPKKDLFYLLQKNVALLLAVSRFLGRVPFFGRVLKRLVPVADYTSVFPLSDDQLLEWALLDTFDMLAPEFDNPQTVRAVKEYFDAAGLIDVEVFHAAHLVGRGRRPIYSQ